MYFKVASIVVVGIFLSGCSVTSNPEPKKPDVKVVEVIENNVTTVAPDPVVEHVRTPSASSAEKKYKLKPEPFSLESNEDDPELLGPQSTIDRDTDKPQTVEKKSKKALSRKVKEEKDKFTKAKDENLPSEDNKKEAL